MKIAFVFPPMWSPHSDGSLQIWNREVAARLAKSAEVLVYAGHFSQNSPASVNGVQYHYSSTTWDERSLTLLRGIRKLFGVPDPLFSSDFWYLGYYLKVALDLRKQNFDVAHIHYYPQFAALIKTINPNLRVILHMHGEWLTQANFKNLGARLSRLDLVVSCSEFVTRSIRAAFPAMADRCKTVPMGLALEEFSFAAAPSQDPSSKRLLCVGRISPEKGIHVLLQAFELVIRQFPDATLTIVGPEWISPRGDITDLSLKREVIASLEPFYNGRYLAQLREKLSPAAAQSITFAGLVAHQDVPSFYEAADIYVCPSLYESFGVSVVEAMAASVPVVATRVGVVPELITDRRSGLLVDTNNAQAIADAIGELFRNAALRHSIASAARGTVGSQFSWETICSSLIRMYQNVPDANAASLEYSQSMKG